MLPDSFPGALKLRTSLDTIIKIKNFILHFTEIWYILSIVDKRKNIHRG